MQFAQRANKTSSHILQQMATNAALNTTLMDSSALVPTSLVLFHLHKTNEHKGATRAHPYALPEPQSPPHPISKMSRACGCFYTHHRSLHPRPVGASMVPTPFRSSHPWPHTTYRTTLLLGGAQGRADEPDSFLGPLGRVWTDLYQVSISLPLDSPSFLDAHRYHYLFARMGPESQDQVRGSFPPGRGVRYD